jgi:hypothetical protein
LRVIQEALHSIGGRQTITETISQIRKK